MPFIVGMNFAGVKLVDMEAKIVKGYTSISATDLKSLDALVVKKIGEGFEPFGQQYYVTGTTAGLGNYIQPMIKYGAWSDDPAPLPAS